MDQSQLEVGMLLYPAFTMLDLVGPMTALQMHSRIRLLWKDLQPVMSDTPGAAMVPNTTLVDCPAKLDVLFVPGGFGTAAAMRDGELIQFLKGAGAQASYVTSVCSGALILGAAGLLEGYQATTHWGAHEFLKDVGAVPVKARFVEDRNRFTGGGVTAGIDFGLALLAKLRGRAAGEMAQLMMEYDPAPPFHAGTPDTAPPQVVEQVRRILEQAAPSFQTTL